MLILDLLAFGGAGAVASAAAFKPEVVEMLTRSLLTRHRTYMVSAPVREFKTVAQTVDCLRIRADSASIFVRQASEISEIKLLSNFPALWTIEAGELMQRSVPSASLLKSDDASKLKLSGLLGAYKETVEPDLVEILDDRTVNINAKPMSLMFRKARLEIVLPDGYKGGLDILCTGDSSVFFEHDWKTGSLRVESNGKGSVTTKSIRDAKSVELIDNGSTSFQVEDVGSSSLSVVLNSGTLKANDINVETFNLDAKASSMTTFRRIFASGVGQMTYRNGSTATLVSELIDCSALTLKLDGSGAVQVGRMRGAACEVWHSARGSWNVPVNEYNSFKFHASGTGGFNTEMMKCVETALFDIAPGSDCVLNITGSIESESLELILRGKAGTNIKTIKGGNCSVLLGSAANANLGEVTLRDLFKSEQPSSGSLAVNSIQSKEASGNVSDRGSLNVVWIDTYDAKFFNSGQGSILVQNGKAVELDLQCTGRGDVNFYAAYKSITMKKNNSGNVNFRPQSSN
jgi:hypothetical protein